MHNANLLSINWSEESLLLQDFINKYELPQIVEVSDGFDGGSYETTIGFGEILKIHGETTEMRLLCKNSKNKNCERIRRQVHNRLLHNRFRNGPPTKQINHPQRFPI